MDQVAVLGVGMVPVDEHWDHSLLDLAGKAAMDAMSDAGLERVDALIVGNMLAATGESGQLNLAAQLADWCGWRGIETYKVEAACASGAAAFRAGVVAVASGQVQNVLVVGAEKMSETESSLTTAALATAADADYEVPHGPSFVALNALVMRRYQHEYGWRHEDFAPFSVNAHANASRNPYARLHHTISTREYVTARIVSDPINILDASPTGDGAAAIVLTRAGKLNGNNVRPKVVIAASAVATDTIAIHSRAEPLRLVAAEQSAQMAYRQSAFRPDQIDFFELHDAFSIMAALSLEAAGLAEQGQGPRLAQEGAIRPDGTLPIATFGGLKARGHPVGATGVYQLAEVTRQLWGEAGDNQLSRARVGMAQSIGGTGATVVTHILRTTP